MTNIISFEQKKTEKSGLVTGPLVCTNCKHKWEGVFEFGTKQFECPSCETSKGVTDYIFVPEIFYQCNCGNDLMFVSPEGIVCKDCGEITSYEDLANLE